MLNKKNVNTPGATVSREKNNPMFMFGKDTSVARHFQVPSSQTKLSLLNVSWEAPTGPSVTGPVSIHRVWKGVSVSAWRAQTFSLLLHCLFFSLFASNLILDVK